MLSFLDALCARLRRVIPGAAAAVSLNSPRLGTGQEENYLMQLSLVASLSTIVLASGAYQDNMITTLNNKICQRDCFFRHQHSSRFVTTRWGDAGPLLFALKP